jgi:tetraacyldisaccharide 4'-kinase
MSVAGEDSLPLETLKGKRVLAVAAVGEPELFRRQLEAIDAEVALAAFRDHHPFSDQDVTDLARRAASSDLVVCTLKDAVKLGRRWPGPSRLWYVSQQLVVDQGAEHVTRLIERVLDARAAAATSAGPSG